MTTSTIAPTPSLPAAGVSRSATRRGAFTREEVHDFAGVAAGVVAGTLAWLVVLSLVRLPV